MIMDREAILRILPHRPPFLFVDRIVRVEGSRIVGELDVTGTEWFFPGHFPGAPVMPGVLILEAMAQTGACLALQSPGLTGRIAYFASIDKVRFRKPVRPGDRLVLEAEVQWVRGRVGKVAARASVNGTPVAEAEFAFAITDAAVPAP